MRKEVEKPIVQFAIMLVIILIVGCLLKYEHYFIGIFILLMYIWFTDELTFKHIYAELSWIKKCVIGIDDPGYLKEQADFYAFVASRIRDKNIKKGMSIEAIYERIDDIIEKDMKNISRNDDYY